MSAEDDREAKSTEPNDRRDEALEGAWRAASQEQPPANLDARILAAARASVGAREEPRSTPRERARWNLLQRWQPLLAAAAVAGLAFVLVPMTMSPPALERATPSTMPQTTESSGTPPGSGPASPDRPRADEDVAGSRMMQSQLPAEPPAEQAPALPERVPRATGDTRVPDASAPVPPPPPAADATASAGVPADPAAADSKAATSSSNSSFGALGPAAQPGPTRAEQAGRMAESPAAAAPSAQAREKSADDSTMTDARKWAERIEAEYRRGDLATAAETLRAFRAVETEADTYLPDDLRDWSRTVR